MKKKKFQKIYRKVWECVKKEIEATNGGEKIEYGKDF